MHLRPFPAAASAAAFLLLALSGCGPDDAAASRAPSPDVAQSAVPAFELQGTRVIGCCCAGPCPCRIDKKPMHMHGCHHTDAVHIEHGFIGATRMDNVDWVVTGLGFGDKTDHNWVVVYLTDRATPEQQQALEGMLGNDLKTWGVKAKHLAGEFKGVKRAPITFQASADHREYHIVIPTILDLKTRAIVLPGHSEPATSAGIMDAFGDRFVQADPLIHTYQDDQLQHGWDLSGRQANQADFVLTPARVAKGGIGWGCWTAHAEFGDQGQYQEQMIGHDTEH